jgi:hypothetical protein
MIAGVIASPSRFSWMLPSDCRQAIFNLPRFASENNVSAQKILEKSLGFSIYGMTEGFF